MRFRFAGIATLVVATVSWCAWFAPFDDLLDRSGTPLGGDYVMLYTAGLAASTSHQYSLYDDAHNQLLSSEVFPTLDPSESWPFRYPPTVAVVMRPLSALPFAASFAVFCIVQFLFLGLAAGVFRNLLPQYFPQWRWAILGCPLVIETLLGGQSSLLGLAIVALTILLMSGNRQVSAGAVLALSLYKPNVLFVFSIVCLIKHPRMLIGFLPTAILGVLVAALTVGTGSIVEYLALGQRLAVSAWSLETPFWKVHGLGPWLAAVSPHHGKLLCSLLGLAAATLIGVAWRQQRIKTFAALSLALVCNALLNPYVPIYDLVLLIAAAICFAKSISLGEMPSFQARMGGALLVLLSYGPHVSQALSQHIGLQLFPIALLLATAWLVVRALPAHGLKPSKLSLS